MISRFYVVYSKLWWDLNAAVEMKTHPTKQRFPLFYYPISESRCDPWPFLSVCSSFLFLETSQWTFWCASRVNYRIAWIAELTADGKKQNLPPPHIGDDSDPQSQISLARRGPESDPGTSPPAAASRWQSGECCVGGELFTSVQTCHKHNPPANPAMGRNTKTRNQKWLSYLFPFEGPTCSRADVSNLIFRASGCWYSRCFWSI